MADDIIPLGPKFEYPVEIAAVASTLTLTTIKTPTTGMALVTYSLIGASSGATHQALYLGWQLATTRNGGVTGTSITPTPRDFAVASACTVLVNITASDHTYADDDYLFSGIGYSSLGQWEQRGAFWIRPNEIWGLKMQTAPTSAVDIAGSVCYHEIGGASRTA